MQQSLSYAYERNSIRAKMANDSISVPFGQFSQLPADIEKLTISHIDHLNLTDLQRFKNLRVLSLGLNDNQSISQDLLGHVSDSIRELNLEGKFGEEIFQNISRFQNLEQLYLHSICSFFNFRICRLPNSTTSNAVEGDQAIIT